VISCLQKEPKQRAKAAQLVAEFDKDFFLVRKDGRAHLKQVIKELPPLHQRRRRPPEREREPVVPNNNNNTPGGPVPGPEPNIRNNNVVEGPGGLPSGPSGNYVDGGNAANASQAAHVIPPQGPPGAGENNIAGPGANNMGPGAKSSNNADNTATGGWNFDLPEDEGDEV